MISTDVATEAMESVEEGGQKKNLHLRKGGTTR
jgi:hypothetical protein